MSWLGKRAERQIAKRAPRAGCGGPKDEPARKAAMAKLAQIEMRQAIAEEARRKFLRQVAAAHHAPAVNS